MRFISGGMQGRSTGSGMRGKRSMRSGASQPPPPDPVETPNWFVSPTGGATSGTAGDKDNPFALSYALNGAGGRIGPGHLVYLLDGTYTYSSIIMNLSGAAGSPIRFKPEPGAWVKFVSTNVGTQGLTLRTVHYVEFYDIEFTVTEAYDRTVQTTSSSPGCHVITGSGGYVQSHVKFFGCYFHDHKGMGIKFWEYTAEGIEFNGCLTWYNGNDPSHDHNSYDHNEGTYPRLLKDCIYHNAAGFNYHCYDDGARPINNFHFDGCVFYKAGGLYSQTPRQNLLIGGNGSDGYNNKVENCFLFDTTGNSTHTLRVGYGDTALMFNTTIRNNISVGRPWRIENGGEGYVIENNRVYFGTGMSTITRDRLTGNGNVLAAVPTTGKDIFVRAYDWDSKRANIVIYNHEQASTVSITHAMLAAAGVNIQAGATFKLINTGDPLNDIITGTYNGSEITVSMVDRTVQVPFGGIPAPASTFPRFGCFILRVTS